MQGKVYLVGAGPGDPGLLTIKGRQVLLDADVVVYDALVGPGVLAMIPRGAEVINVGKRAANHTMPQEEINQLLLELAQKGKKVVRLKGGDPFLFGRGGEEIELLEEHGVPFEIVPGITSAISVPAYNGIPVTHRDFCSSVHIITGHKKKDAQYDIDFDALVRTGGTLVFLMGVSSLGDICRGLMEAGMDPDRAAAVLQEGTTARQRRVTASVATLERKAKEAGIKAPAIIVVGDVCSLADRFAWYEKKPLAGKRILVTRPKELISKMAQLLRDQGAEVVELPAIKTVPASDLTALEEALFPGGSAKAPDWIVFTSPTGVRIFFEYFLREHDIRQLHGARFAVIGSGSAKELLGYGIRADFVPSVYDGETLGRELAPLLCAGMRVVIPRAAIGNRQLTDHLGEVPGLEVLDIPIYDTVYEASSLIDEKKLFEEGGIDYAVFTSASTVKGFAAATDGLDYSAVHAVCIGKQTKAAADALGMATYMAQKATMESLLERVIGLAGEENR